MLPLATRGRGASIAIALLILSPARMHSQTAAPPYLSPAATITAADYAARRAAVTAKGDSGVLLAFGGGHPPDYLPDFYQMPNFEYLTGFDESDAAMLILKRRGATASAMMFVSTQSPIMLPLVC